MGQKVKCHRRKCKSFKETFFVLKTFFANSQRDLKEEDLSSNRIFVCMSNLRSGPLGGAESALLTVEDPFKCSDFDDISSRANEHTCLFPTKILKQKVGKVSLLP